MIHRGYFKVKSVCCVLSYAHSTVVDLQATRTRWIW